MFLVILGLFVIFGICFIDAQSPPMETALVHVTIFSCSILCYILADLDTPFCGFFQIDLTVLPEVVEKAEQMYNELQADDMH